MASGSVDLTPLRRDHFAELASALADEQARELLRTSAELGSGLASAQAGLEREIRGQQIGVRLPFAILLDQRPIGVCGLSQQGRSLLEADVYYWLARCHWGRGIATGAVRLLLVQARSQPLLQVVCSSVLTSNPASRRVLEKNGFQVTATTTACSAFYPRFAGRQVWHLSRRLFDP